MNGDEVGHLIRQLAQQQLSGFRPMLYGHISTYDPTGNRVKVIFPSLRDDDNAPTQSGWMPLASMSVGNGYGIQVAPVGGSTLTNPTAGEQVLVAVLDHKLGVCACLGMTYNGAAQPPSTVLEQPLLPGEVVIFNNSGTFWRLHANGNAEMNAQGTIIATATGNIDINAVGQANVTAPIILFDGASTMNGDLLVNGNINATGTIGS